MKGKREKIESADQRIGESARSFIIHYSSFIVLFFLGLIIEAACFEIVRIGDLRTGMTAVMIGGHAISFPVFWLPYLAAFLPYLMAVWWMRSRVATPGNDADLKRLLIVILGFAVVFRATMLFSPPTLSDDIFRYVWDGKMQNQGINPYLYPPNGEEIVEFRDEYYPGINNKPISTIYPPLLQMAFRITDRIAHTPFAMKILFVLCDLAVIAVTLLLLQAHALPLPLIIIYAWNPLLLIEIAGSGHNDPLALVLMLAAILAVTRQRHNQAIAYLAMSFLAKFLSVILMPAFFKSIRRIRPFLIFPALVVLFYLPFIDAGFEQLFHGLFVYGDKWRFNDSLFSVFLMATGSVFQAKIIIAAIFATIVLARLLGDPSHMRTAYLLVGAYLLLTPTLQPWYLVWIAPFLCFYPNRAWMMLTGLIVISYDVLVQFTQTGIWKEAIWVRYVQYIPFYALLVYDAARDKIRKSKIENRNSGSRAVLSKP